MFPEKTAGIRDDSDKLNSYIYNPYGYISNGRMTPGENAENAIRISEAEVREAVDKINSFFANEWIAWRNDVEKLNKPLFKDFEKL